MIVLGGAVATIAVWWALAARYRNRYARPYPRSRTIAFLAGSAIAVAALSPPLDDLADVSFTWHMVQHMMLVMLAPPVLLLAAPVELALAAAPPRVARALVALVRRPPISVLQRPVAGWLAFVAVLWGAHFSALYEAAAENEMLHAGEHALFLTAAFAFWAPVVGATPFAAPLPYPVRILYLFTAMPCSAFLGFALYVMRVSPYAHYPAVLDVQSGGELMWIVGGAAMVFALMMVALAWARSEQRYAGADVGGAGP